MTGFTMKLRGTRFAANRTRASLYPRTDLIRGVYLFAGNSPRLLQNYVASNTSPLSQVGAPSIGISGGVITAAGSGGTDGTNYSLVIPAPATGGTQAVGTFDVSGGSLVAESIKITTAGTKYTGPYLLTNSAFVACTGLTGAAVTLNTLSCACNNTNYFETGLVDTASYAFLAVVKGWGATSFAAVGTYKNGSPGTGDALASVSGGTIRNYVDLGGSVSSATQISTATAMAATRWRVVGGYVDAVGLKSGLFTWDDTGLLVPQSITIATRGSLTGRTYRAGCAQDTSVLTGTCQIAGLMIFSGPFTAVSDQTAGRASFQNLLGNSLGNAL